MRRSRSNVLRDGLTPSQERAIRALLTARSVAAAARQANVGQSTLRRWLREDDNFQNELRQYRQEALSHAALILQQRAAEAVCIMYELIQSGRPVDRGRVSLIRTAIEYAFRAAVYLDIIDRVKALEKAQRRRLGDPTPPTRPATAPRSRLGAPNQETATHSKQRTSHSKQGAAQDPRKPKAVFLRSTHSCSRPAAEAAGNFRKSAHNCSPHAIGPHFSPNGEARRGARLPAGRVGLRADVASTRVLSTASKRNEAMAGLSGTSPRHAVRKADISIRAYCRGKAFVTAPKIFANIPPSACTIRTIGIFGYAKGES